MIGRLERLASLNTGRDGRLRRQLFRAWLESSLPRRVADLRSYFESSGCDARLALSEECYRILVPPAASETEKRLFFCALQAALASLRNECVRGLSRPRVAAMLELAEQHQGNISLEEVSRALGQSRRHLGQLFARRTGVAFRSYSASLRMLRAVELLRDPSQSVQSIAAALGYADTSNFARQFRRTLGTTPAGIRDGLPDGGTAGATSTFPAARAAAPGRAGRCAGCGRRTTPSSACRPAGSRTGAAPG
ncbi:MAG: helix-turn-helix transcriptional regulator [Bryobacterales bacterium]|nr:helix-turn-helix transcriptional regulator [Bryobacterales bacterium]